MWFNSRTPGGVRRCKLLSNCYTKSVSIHAPREGCDEEYGTLPSVDGAFQFTHPGRGATHYGVDVPRGRGVSIHAPREGCDTVEVQLMQANAEFQFTHPGRGATATRSNTPFIGRRFQFTHPGRGATYI